MEELVQGADGDDALKKAWEGTAKDLNKTKNETVNEFEKATICNWIKTIHGIALSLNTQCTETVNGFNPLINEIELNLNRTGG